MLRLFYKMKYEPLLSIFIQFSAAIIKETISRRDLFRSSLNHEYKGMKTLGQTHTIYFCFIPKMQIRFIFPTTNCDVDKILFLT